MSVAAALLGLGKAAETRFRRLAQSGYGPAIRACSSIT
jgi:hypothetical protein